MTKVVLFNDCVVVKQVCHRDLKLENTLLDGSTAPRLKICDFGYSKVFLFYIVCCAAIMEPIAVTDSRLGLDVDHVDNLCYTIICFTLWCLTLLCRESGECWLVS